MSHLFRARHWRIAGCLVLLLLGVLSPAQAVGTLSVTGPTNGLITIAWTSSAGGAVSGNSFTVPNAQIKQVKYVPGSGGSQPTDLYDITLTDADGLDLLGGTGANLSNAAAALFTDLNVWIVLPAAANTVDLVVANAGNAKSGTVYLLLVP